MDSSFSPPAGLVRDVPGSPPREGHSWGLTVDVSRGECWRCYTEKQVRHTGNEHISLQSKCIFFGGEAFVGKFVYQLDYRVWGVEVRETFKKKKKRNIAQPKPESQWSTVCLSPNQKHMGALPTSLPVLTSPPSQNTWLQTWGHWLTLASELTRATITVHLCRIY